MTIRQYSCNCYGHGIKFMTEIFLFSYGIEKPRKFSALFYFLKSNKGLITGLGHFARENSIHAFDTLAK